MDVKIALTVNGRPVTVATDPKRPLLDVLREDLQLTGTKYGCGEGHCGACTVVVDGKAVRSCLTLVKEVRGKEVLTIEGLSTNGRLHPLQQAFVDHDALQCGFCTPGMIMNAYSMLLRNKKLTRRQILDGMEHNLCRCSGHKRIVQAIESVSTKK